MTSNGKQFNVTREMLTAFVLFGYLTNHLITSSRVTLRFSGKKIHCSPYIMYIFNTELAMHYRTIFKYVFSQVGGFLSGERLCCYVRPVFLDLVIKAKQDQSSCCVLV